MAVYCWRRFKIRELFNSPLWHGTTVPWYREGWRDAVLPISVPVQKRNNKDVSKALNLTGTALHRFGINKREKLTNHFADGEFPGLSWPCSWVDQKPLKCFVKCGSIVSDRNFTKANTVWCSQRCTLCFLYLKWQKRRKNVLIIVRYLKD